MQTYQVSRQGDVWSLYWPWWRHKVIILGTGL